MIKALFGKRSVADNAVSVPMNIVFNIIFTAGVAICLYPFLLVISVSLTGKNDLFQYGYRIIPARFTLESYRYIFAMGSNIFRAYGITVFNTVVGTFLHLFLVSMFSYPLSRPEFEFKGFFTKMIIIPMFLSGGLVPWYLVCTQMLRLTDTIWAMIIPMAFSGWNAIIMRIFIKRNIPDEVIESARIDGSSEFRTYIRIVLPMSKAGLAAIGYMVALGFWNDWWLPLILIRNPELHNLQYMLYKIINMTQMLSQMIRGSTSGSLEAAAKMSANIPGESLRMAMAVIAIGPIAFAFPLFQKQFIKGIVVGSLKG